MGWDEEVCVVDTARCKKMPRRTMCWTSLYQGILEPDNYVAFHVLLTLQDWMNQAEMGVPVIDLVHAIELSAADGTRNFEDWQVQ